MTTRRLKLSTLVESDAEALFNYRSDPNTCRYQSFEPGSLDDARDFISALERHTFGIPGTWFQFGIRLRDSGRLVGDIGAHFIEDRPGQVEIGITLDAEQQGKGY
ncbi:MAG TPA: GNAT family N-acetyltransferase, partial [Candidatus Krumholzibacterium sp.]|nr:GNAT family N-acetyltransferase [Candidatus Krumholzibacterium sp.]